MSGVVGLAALFVLPGFAHKSEGQLTISQSRVASAGTTVETDTSPGVSTPPAGQPRHLL